MMLRNIAMLLSISLLTGACNLNATNGDGGNPEPDEDLNFEVIKSSGIPGNTTKAKAVDLDNNGAADLVLAIEGQRNTVMINEGSDGFTEDSTRLPDQGYSFNTRDLTIADFNGDGYPDLFFVSNEFDGYELYINNSQGYFNDSSNRIPVTDIATSVAAWDIDNSGTTDIMIGTVGQNLMLMNNGSLAFTNQTGERLPTQSEVTTDVEAGDLTGDNLHDIITSSGQSNRLLVNMAAGSFLDQTDNFIPSLGAVGGTMDIELVDLTTNGYPDIFFGNAGVEDSSAIQDRIFINQGQVIFSDQTADRLPDNSTGTIDAEFADLDNDGDMDLIIGSAGSGIQILMNDGSGSFTDNSSEWIPETFTPTVNDVEVADFNNDQLPDLYIAVEDGADRMLLQR